MKARIFIIVFILFSFKVSCQEYDFGDKEVSSYGTLIKMAPFVMLNGNVSMTGEFGLSLEQKIGLKASIEASGAYVGKGLLFLMTEDLMYNANDPKLTINGYRLQADIRYYLTKKHAPEGLYLAPHFSYTHVKFSDKTNKQLGNYILVQHFDYSAIIGYQFVFGRFSLEAYLGATYRVKKWTEKFSQTVTILSDEEIQDFYLLNTPIRPKFNIALGFAF